MWPEAESTAHPLSRRVLRGKRPRRGHYPSEPTTLAKRHRAIVRIAGAEGYALPAASNRLSVRGARLEIRDGHHQRHGVERGGGHAEGEVERLRVLGNCLDENAANADNAGRL